MIKDKEIIIRGKELYNDLCTSTGYTKRPPVQESDVTFLLLLIGDLQLKIEELKKKS